MDVEKLCVVIKPMLDKDMNLFVRWGVLEKPTMKIKAVNVVPGEIWEEYILPTIEETYNHVFDLLDGEQELFNFIPEKAKYGKNLKELEERFDILREQVVL